MLFYLIDVDYMCYVPPFWSVWFAPDNKTNNNKHIKMGSHQV